MPRSEPRDDEFLFHDSAVHIPPGDYLAFCERGWLYVDPVHRKWTLLLHWTVLTDGGFEVLAENVCQWFNLGPIDRKPKITRRCNYFLAWHKAAGREPSRTRMKDMKPSIFMGKLARVRVADSSGASPFSKVFEILSFETGVPANPSNAFNNPNVLNDPNEQGIVRTASWRAAYEKLVGTEKAQKQADWRKRRAHSEASTLARAEGNQPVLSRTGAVCNASPQRHTQ
jgi:hypothetical protein